MSRIFALLFLLLVITPIAAQDGYPLPNDLTPITIDNAAHIEKLATLGTAAPGALVWSPDGNTLAVTTNDAVRLYQGAELAASPHLFPTGKAAFESDTVLVIDGQRWDIQTGEKLAELPAPARPILSPSGNIEVQPIYEDNQQSLLLKKASGKEIRLPIGGEYSFNQIIFSPDEQYAIINLLYFSEGWSYPTLQLWNVEQGEFVAELPQMLEILDTVAFHADGKIIVTSATTDSMYGGPFEDVKIWDGHTGENIGPRSMGLLPVYFSPDGRLMAFFSTGFTFWTDHEIGTVPYNNGYYGEGERPEIIFSPNGQTVILKDGERQILFWDVSGDTVPSEPSQVLSAENEIATLLFTLDGKRIIASEANHILEVWDTQTGKRLNRLETGQTYSNAILSPDGRRLRVGESLLLDVETMQPLLDDAPVSAIWDTNWTKAAYWDRGDVRVKNSATGQETRWTVIENYQSEHLSHADLTASMAFRINTALQGYDLATGQMIFSQPIPENQVPQILFNPNGRYFLTSAHPLTSGTDTNQSMQLWMVANLEQPISTFDFPNYYGFQLLSLDGQLLSIINGACGDGGGGSYHLWSTITGQQLFGWYPGGTCGPYDHTFTLDGKYIIVAWASKVTIIDIAVAIKEAASSDGRLTGGWIGTVYYDDIGQQIKNIILSPDSALLAVQTNTRLVEDESGPAVQQSNLNLYQLADLTKLVKPGTANVVSEPLARIPGAITAIFSPDGRWLLTDNGFWNTATGEQMAAVAGKIAAFSPDGTILATVDTAGVTLWDVATLTQGEEIPLATWAVSSVSDVAFSPDATRLYVRRASDIQTWGIPKR